MKPQEKYWLEKERMCDPGMCRNCEYIGNGDFTCNNPKVTNNGPKRLVVENWMSLYEKSPCKMRHGGQR